jgi:hypothetical protein
MANEMPPIDHTAAAAADDTDSMLAARCSVEAEGEVHRKVNGEEVERHRAI